MQDQRDRKMQKILARSKQTKPRTMQFLMPEAPSGDCLNFEAYNYTSGTECDGIWKAWDEWCWDGRVDQETYDAFCSPVEDALNKAYADSLNAVRPEGECLDWMAWLYESPN